MPKGRKKRWHVYRNGTTGESYVVSPGQRALSPHDIAIDQFDNEADATAYSEEANAIELEQQSESGTGVQVPYPNEPQQYGSVVSDARRDPAAVSSGQGAMPVPGLPGQAGQPQQATAGQERELSQEIWHGRPVESLPQELADRIDEAGLNYDAITSAINANSSLIVGNCRQGIGSCTAAVDNALSPVVRDATERLQLVRQTIVQYAADQLMAVMSNAAVVREAAGVGYSYTGSAVTDRTLVPGAIGTGPVVAPPAIGQAPPGGPTPTGPLTGIMPAPIPGQPGWTLWSDGTDCVCRRDGDTNVGGDFHPVGFFATFEQCNNARQTCGTNPPPPLPPPPPEPILPPPPNPIDNIPLPPPNIDNFPTTPPPAGGWFIGIGGFYFYMPPGGPPPGFLCSPTGQGCRHPDGSITPIYGPGGAGACFSSGGYSVTLPLCPDPGYYGPFPSPIPPTTWGPPSPTPPPPPTNTIIGTPPPPPIGSPPPPQCCPPPVTNVYCSPGTSPSPQPPIGGPPPPTNVIIGSPPPPVHVSPPTEPPPLPALPTGSGAGDYCVNIAFIRTQFIELGRRVLREGTVRHELMADLTKEISGIGYFAGDGLRQLMHNAEQSRLFQSAMFALKVITNQYHNAISEDYYALLAAKNFVDAMASYAVSGAGNCVGDSSLEISVAPSFFGIGGGWTSKADYASTQGTRLEIKAFLVPLQETLDKCIRWTCSEVVPSIQEALSLYILNTISLEHCQCLVGLNGGVWDEYLPSIQAQRAKFDALQNVQLWMRGQFGRRELDKRIREIGFLNHSDVDDVIELAKWIPGPTDLIRFMVRDVADETVATEFKLDKEFTKKYAGRLQEFGRAQGIEPDIFKFAWRAHWDWPSNTQLYEMLHRLRPDNRPEGRTAEDWDVTKELASRVLAINDVIPEFRQRFIDISYRPLTRVDARRAFNLGSLSDDEMLSAIKDQGYDDKNARRLLRFSKTLRDQSVRANRWVKQYVAGSINVDQLKQHLTDDGMPDELIDKAVDFARDELKTAGRLACVKAIRKRYSLGEFDKETAKQALIVIGMDAEQADAFATILACERSARAKQLSAASLCKYADRGLMNASEMGERLLKMGYSVADAVLIVQECGIRIAERQAKAAEALAKKTAAEQEKIRKAQEKLQRDLENARKAQLRASAAVQKEHDRQQAAFTKAALKMSHIRGISATDSANEMESATIFGYSSGGITVAEAVELAIDVANSWKAREERPFSVAYSDALRAYQDAVAITASTAQGE